MQISTEQDHGYDSFEKLVAIHTSEFAKLGPIFETMVPNLWDIYLDSLPQAHRQHYTCHACRRFIERYGHLVVIEKNGLSHPLLWGSWNEGLPEFFAHAITRFCETVRKAKIKGVFVSSDQVWGQPVTGQWTHLHAQNPRLFKDVTQTADQVMAERKQDYIMLKRALSEISLPAAEQAVRVLEADALDRSEKTLGMAKWFLDLQKLQGSPVKDHLLWYAVATAPPGYCHIRSGMLSTLLDDIIEGLPFDSIKKRWNEKMHPLQYQRPTAAPKDGAIKQAEELFEKLSAAGALRRRYAELRDIQQFLWQPQVKVEAPAAAGGGIFDHLKAKNTGVNVVDLPSKTMTWEKLQRDILPNARTMEIFVPHHSTGFVQLVTAADENAPPIIQWDGEPRNPVSWYLYHTRFGNGMAALHWNLKSNTWTKVTGICYGPSQWQQPEKFTHQGERVIFLIEGCQDTNKNQGIGLFPEIMKAEFHGVRSVLEAYSKKAIIEGVGSAAGLAMVKGRMDRPIIVRVNDDATYELDRWE